MWLKQALACECNGNGPLMLIFLPLSLQGIYVFAVYFIMHNQLCWPTKASYTVEMSGHDGPDPSYQGGGPKSVRGDVNKSTQNLISAMEEVTWHSLTSDHKHCLYILVLEERKFIFHFEAFFEDFIYFFFCLWFKQTWTFSSFKLLVLPHTPSSRNTLQMILNIK